jgi:CheY-like chemotaxis protein
MVNILVVDDSAVDRRLAGGLLERNANWKVSYAQHGQEALERIREALPDAVLTDLQMPVMGGLELVRLVKKDHPQIPVVLMTAQGSELVAVNALEEGADSYVPKRQITELLLDTMERVLVLSSEVKTRQSLARCLRGMRCSFVLTNEPSLLSSLVSHLQQLVRDMNLFNEGERLRIGVALEEALLNAAYHGNLEVSSKLREIDHSAFYELARQRMQMPPYAERRIFVDVEICPEQVEYVIRDEGPGFDLRTLPNPTDPENLDRPCGRGLLLMRTFMDRIDYNDCGNQVTMTKQIRVAKSVGLAD